MARTKNRGRCAYCPKSATTTDHVIPKGLYPLSIGNSKFQRVTVPCCEECNGAWSKDEDHFRAILLMAGETTPIVRELWDGPTHRSFRKIGGTNRARAIFDQMIPMTVDNRERHMIFPGRDPRVMRIIRKIVRGLCHHHNLLSPVSDGQVWENVVIHEVPQAFRDAMPVLHAEPGVLEYQYGAADDVAGMHTGWLLRFFERTEFIAIVYDSAEAYNAAFEGGPSEVVAR